MTLCPDNFAPIEICSPSNKGVATPIPQANKVLIIEDDPDNFVLASSIMEEAGYRVIGASTGTAAIAQLQKHTVHLILMDVLLPDMDGFALRATMRQNHRNAHIPVVAITALAPIPARHHLLETNFDSYLIKPYSIEALEAVAQIYCPL